MSKTMTGLVRLVALLAVAATGVGAYATGQGSRMSDQQVQMKAQPVEDGAERRAEIHTDRLLSDQEDAHAKDLKQARNGPVSVATALGRDRLPERQRGRL